MDTQTISPFAISVVLSNIIHYDMLQKCSVSEEGELKPLFWIAYSKVTKDFTAKEVKEDKNQEYLFYILRKIVKRVKPNKKASKKERSYRKKRGKIAPVERPARESIIRDSQKFKRIKL